MNEALDVIRPATKQYFTRVFISLILSEVTLSDATGYMPVSILIPAYNEALTIVDTILSVEKVDYAELEIIVIDDGSKDSTAQTVIDYFKLNKIEHPLRRQVPCKEVREIWETEHNGIPIMLICKENGGKADALNMGINAARYAYFLEIDADSVLQKDAVKNLMEPILEDERIIACGGYGTGIVREDMELVVKLHHFCKCNKLPYKIINVPDAIGIDLSGFHDLVFCLVYRVQRLDHYYDLSLQDLSHGYRCHCVAGRQGIFVFVFRSFWIQTTDYLISPQRLYPIQEI